MKSYFREQAIAAAADFPTFSTNLAPILAVADPYTAVFYKNCKTGLFASNDTYYFISKYSCMKLNREAFNKIKFDWLLSKKPSEKKKRVRCKSIW